MPIYSYKCTSCSHHFEVRQRFSDDPVAECPVCGSPVRKVITPVGIVFKGSGFYVTDNKNGKASSTLNGSGSTSRSAEQDDSKSDTKKASTGTKSASTDSASATSAA